MNECVQNTRKVALVEIPVKKKNSIIVNEGVL